MLATPRPGPINYTGRTALAFVLTWMNPFYAIFGVAGFFDVYDSLKGRWVYVAMLAVGITQAGSQSGGFPPDDAAQAWVFVALIGLNAGLATAFMRISLRTEQRTVDLQQLNADLEAALLENQNLQERLVSQAREAGVQEERARLAREIHDTLAQSLAGIVTQLEASVGGERHERALVLARHALAEARRSMLDLSPGDLDGATLPDALSCVVAAWSAEHAVRVDAVVVGDPVPLDPEVEATVIRIAQESLDQHRQARRRGPRRCRRCRTTATRWSSTCATTGSGSTSTPRPGRARSACAACASGSRGSPATSTLESLAGRGTAVSARLPALARVAA